MVQSRFVSPFFIKRLFSDTITGGGREKVKYLHNNGIRYTFLVESGITDEGAKFYAILRNEGSKKGHECLYGEIDLMNKHKFIIMNINKNRGCGVPFEDKGLTKRMFGLIIRILKKEEPEVNLLEVTDNAGVYCIGGTKSIYLSDLFMLKGEPSFYEKLGFVTLTKYNMNRVKNNTNGVYSNVNRNNLIITRDNIEKRIIKVEYIGKLIEAVYGTGDSEFDDYIDDCTIEFDKEEMTLAEMVIFLVENHCIVYQKFAKALMWKYGIRSVVGEQFYREI